MYKKVVMAVVGVGFLASFSVSASNHIPTPKGWDVLEVNGIPFVSKHIPAPKENAKTLSQYEKEMDERREMFIRYKKDSAEWLVYLEEQSVRNAILTEKINATLAIGGNDNTKAE